jgi:cobalt-zinc-cadmium resistance protein CzcA
VPAAFSTGIGSQVQRPLATVVVGGMLLGPLMLLVVVPALQLVFLRKEGVTAGRFDLPPPDREVTV